MENKTNTEYLFRSEVLAPDYPDKCAVTSKANRGQEAQNDYPLEQLDEMEENEALVQ